MAAPKKFDNVQEFINPPKLPAPEQFDTVQEFINIIPPKLVMLRPSQYIIFNMINITQRNSYLHTRYLRIAVYDSPIDLTTNTVAAMIVPVHREADWVFSTQLGHTQILFDNPRFSRLILIGNTHSDNLEDYFLDPFPNIDNDQRKSLENSLRPLVTMLCHRAAFEIGSIDLDFLTYKKDDDVICRFVEKQCMGRMLIEIIGLKSNDKDIDFRRRMRFMETPDVIQSEIRIFANLPIQNVTYMVKHEHKFMPNTEDLTQPYLTAMVAGLSLIASRVDDRNQHKFKRRALCVGVGGGSLVCFLNATLGFDVVGVEVNTEVLWVARDLFGLKRNEHIRLIAGDAIELIEELRRQRPKRFVQLPYNMKELDLGYQSLIPIKELDVAFDAIMVNLFSSSVPVIAPPSEFMQESVLEASKSVLNEGGILVINVFRRLDDQCSYDSLVQSLRKIFDAVYKNVVEDDEGNVVLIATTLSKKPLIEESEDSFSTRLGAGSSVCFVCFLRNI